MSKPETQFLHYLQSVSSVATDRSGKSVKGANCETKVNSGGVQYTAVCHALFVRQFHP
jgi:hypothetical protein